MQIFLFILLLIFKLILGGSAVNSPVSVKSISIETKVDSTFLAIKIFKNYYSISLLRDSLTTTDISLIDKFISTNINRIQTDKIFVIGQANTQYSQFKKLKNVLKKHEFYKFRINTTEVLDK